MELINIRAAETERSKVRECEEERNLWAAVIMTTVEDLAGDQWGGSLGHHLTVRDRRRLRADAMAYLRSEWFEAHCGWLNLDPDFVRDGIRRRVEQRQRRGHCLAEEMGL